jgi:hypothetical protein
MIRIAYKYSGSDLAKNFRIRIITLIENNKMYTGNQ